MSLTEWEVKMKRLHLQELGHISEALDALKKITDAIGNISDDLQAVRRHIDGQNESGPRPS